MTANYRIDTTVNPRGSADAEAGRRRDAFILISGEQSHD